MRYATLLRFVAAAALVSLAAACSPNDDSATDVYHPRDDALTDNGTDVPDVVTCTPGEIVCAGSMAQTCNGTGDGWSATVACTAPTPVCLTNVGCVVCRPLEPSCDGLNARRCLGDGSGWEQIDVCDEGAGERCSLGYCTDLSEPCETARLENSYEGCDYWPVQLSNAGLPDPAWFRYALVIGNRQAMAANVEVFNRDGVVTSAVVAPNTTYTLELNWNEALRAPISADLIPVFSSSVVPNGAFRVKSDVPVTVYQFNSLKYWGSTLSPLQPGSYTNDASLLLPRHVLTGDYIVASRPTFMISQSNWLTTQFSGGPGVLSIVGLEDGTEVQVGLRSNIQGGAGVSAFRRGETASFTINRFDVVQLLSEVPADCVPVWTEPHPADPTITIGYCDMGSDFDLTGSEITANKPIAVYGGHDCTFVPFDRWACDHLEEQMFPLQAWGTRYLGTHTHPVAGEPNLWRVISGTDGNTIRFNPGVYGDTPLNRTEWFEFESVDDFEVSADGAFLLVEYLVGQGSTLDAVGDPSMGLAVPVEQYRLAYNFLAPEDYRDDPAAGVTGVNYVNVMAKVGSSVMLDGSPVSGLAAIGGGEFGVARVPIEGGSHVVTSDQEFGIMCYGYGNYTSYMYPGGLDVDQIFIY